MKTKLLTLLTLIGCTATAQENFHINGTVTNIPLVKDGDIVYLQKITRLATLETDHQGFPTKPDNTLNVDSTILQNGTFHFTGSTPQPTIANVNIGHANFPVILENGNIQLDIRKPAGFDNLKIYDGTTLNQQFGQGFALMALIVGKATAAYIVTEKLNEKPDTAKFKCEECANALIQQVNDAKQDISNHCDSLYNVIVNNIHNCAGRLLLLNAYPLLSDTQLQHIAQLEPAMTPYLNDRHGTLKLIRTLNQQTKQELTQYAPK